MKWSDPVKVNWRQAEQVGDSLAYCAGWAVLALIAFALVVQVVKWG